MMWRVVFSQPVKVANDLLDFGGGFVQPFEFVDVEVDMDGCGAAMGLDAGTATPLWADQVVSVRQVLAQSVINEPGVARGIAVRNDDSSGRINDMSFGIDAKDFGILVDAADLDHDRMAGRNVLELTFAVWQILRRAEQTNS